MGGGEGRAGISVTGRLGAAGADDVYFLAMPELASDGLPIRRFATAKAWETWLAKNHDRSDGIWLRIAKKGGGATSVSNADALETALCYGWIDGLRHAQDDEFYRQRYSPRRSRSVWSKINVAKVEQLIAAGRMKPAGLAQVQAAKEDGRWAAAYDPQGALTVPDDLVAALKKKPSARKFFEQLDKTNRYAICFRIQSARRPETRAARLEKLVAMLERREKIHP